MTTLDQQKRDSSLKEPVLGKGGEPGDVEKHRLKGKEYVEQKEYEQAVQELDQIVALGLADEEVYRYRGVALSYLDREREAIEDFDRAIQLDPRELQNYISRAVTVASLEGFQSALKEFFKIVAFAPQSSCRDCCLFRAYFCIGLMYYNMDENAAALDYYDRAIDLFRTHAESGGRNHDMKSKQYLYDIFYMRGVLYLEQGEAVKAVEDLTRAIGGNPGEKAIHYYRGIGYGAMGAVDRAIQDLNEALKEYPEWWKPYWVRGTLYAATGHLFKAFRDWVYALSLEYDEIRLVIWVGIRNRLFRIVIPLSFDG